jgi:hypothetical protein
VRLFLDGKLALAKSVPLFMTGLKGVPSLRILRFNAWRNTLLPEMLRSYPESSAVAAVREASAAVRYRGVICDTHVKAVSECRIPAPAGWREPDAVARSCGVFFLTPVEAHAILPMQSWSAVTHVDFEVLFWSSRKSGVSK